MTKCKSCGEQIASDANACPKCGSPNKKGGCLKTIGLVCGALFALMVIAALMSDGDGTSGDSISSSSSDDNAQVVDVSSEVKHGIGDLVSFEDSDWTVIEALELGNTLKGDGFVTETKRSEGKYILVRYKVLNKTKEEQSVLFTPAVQDSQGRKFEEFDETEMYLPEGQTGMTLAQLPAGLPKTFSAIFEVPANADGLRFMARNFAMLATKEKAISLGF